MTKRTQYDDAIDAGLAAWKAGTVFYLPASSPHGDPTMLVATLLDFGLDPRHFTLIQSNHREAVLFADSTLVDSMRFAELKVLRRDIPLRDALAEPWIGPNGLPDPAVLD